jgi:hypothetical protein
MLLTRSPCLYSNVLCKEAMLLANTVRDAHIQACLPDPGGAQLLIDFARTRWREQSRELRQGAVYLILPHCALLSERKMNFLRCCARCAQELCHVLHSSCVKH